MNRRLGVSEILKLISDLPEELDRQRSLATCADNSVLMMTLKYMFDPDIAFDLPEGDPPFKENEFLDQQSNYYSEFRKMYLFIKGGNPNLTDMRRQTLFVQFIEGLDPADARLVLAVKDKRSPYSNITEELVRKTFPGLLAERAEEINIPEPVVEKRGSGARIEELERACPFGCISSRGSQYYMPGPLTAHLKKKHNFTDEQITQFKKEQYS
jgi:Family of unknown function (DUF6433)